jgi:hypothetical protein
MSATVSRDGKLAYADGRHYVLRVCRELPADASDNTVFRRSLYAKCCFDGGATCRAYGVLMSTLYGCRPLLLRGRQRARRLRLVGGG